MVCVRLHGEDWSAAIRPKYDEIERAAGPVDLQIRNGKTVHLNLNNHYEGSVPVYTGSMSDTDGYRGEVIIFQAPDGSVELDVRLDRENLWLTGF